MSRRSSGNKPSILRQVSMRSALQQQEQPEAILDEIILSGQSFDTDPLSETVSTNQPAIVTPQQTCFVFEHSDNIVAAEVDCSEIFKEEIEIKEEEINSLSDCEEELNDDTLLAIQCEIDSIVKHKKIVENNYQCIQVGESSGTQQIINKIGTSQVNEMGHETSKSTLSLSKIVKASTSSLQNKMPTKIPNNSSQQNFNMIHCYRCSTTAFENVTFCPHLSLIHSVTMPKQEYQLFIETSKIDSSKQCFLCEDQFVSWRCLESHVKITHGLCRICGVKVDISKAIGHIEKHEMKFDMLYQCSICKIDLPLYIMLKAHHTKFHSDCDLKIFTMPRDIQMNCPYCHYSTSCNESLTFHVRLHKPVACINCARLYLPTSTHIFNCNFGKCAICDSLTASGSHVVIAKSNANQIKKVEDSIQDKNKYKVTSIDNVTMTKDTKSTSQQMIIIVKPDPTITNLPCWYCNCRLKDSLAVYLHLQVVHHLCLICNYKFRNESYLREHGKRAHKQYFCKLCDMVVFAFSAIKEHCTTNHPGIENAYEMKRIDDYEGIASHKKCPYCNGSVEPNGLENHLKIHKIIRCTKCSNFIFDKKPCECIRLVTMDNQTECVDPLALDNYTSIATLESADPIYNESMKEENDETDTSEIEINKKIKARTKKRETNKKATTSAVPSKSKYPSKTLKERKSKKKQNVPSKISRKITQKIVNEDDSTNDSFQNDSQYGSLDNDAQNEFSNHSSSHENANFLNNKNKNSPGDGSSQNVSLRRSSRIPKKSSRFETPVFVSTQNNSKTRTLQNTSRIKAPKSTQKTSKKHQSPDSTQETSKKQQSPDSTQKTSKKHQSPDSTQKTSKKHQSPDRNSEVDREESDSCSDMPYGNDSSDPDYVPEEKSSKKKGKCSKQMMGSQLLNELETRVTDKQIHTSPSKVPLKKLSTKTPTTVNSNNSTLELLESIAEEGISIEDKLFKYCYDFDATLMYIKLPKSSTFVYTHYPYTSTKVTIPDVKYINSVPCRYCDKILDDLRQHVAHVMNIHFVCKKCHLHHNNITNLIKHLKKHEAGQVEAYCCKECYKISHSHYEFFHNHLHCRKRQIIRPKLSAKIGQLECPYCALNFLNELDLIKHVTYCHEIVNFNFDLGPSEIQDIKMFLSSQPAFWVESTNDLGSKPTDKIDKRPQPVYKPGARCGRRYPAVKFNEDVPPPPDTLDKLKEDCTSEDLPDKLIEYCTKANSKMQYIRLQNPIFLYLHTLEPMKYIKVDIPTRVINIQCQYCQIVSDSLKDHYEHQIKGHFLCKTCHVTHDSALELLQHLKLHESDTIALYICKYPRCSTLFFSSDDYCQHVESHQELQVRFAQAFHVSARIGSLECPYCCFNFVKESDLIQHISESHKILTRNEQDEENCSNVPPLEESTDSDNISETPSPRVVKKRSSTANVVSSLPGKRQKVLSGLEDIPLDPACDDAVKRLVDYCHNVVHWRNFVSTGNLMFIHQHWNKTSRSMKVQPLSRVNNIPCLHCSANFTSLREHFAHQVGQHFICKTCQVTHSDWTSLLSHLWQHWKGKIKIILCTCSFKVFVSETEWLSHLQTHPDCKKTEYTITAKVGELECPYCLLNFVNELDLIFHVITSHPMVCFTFELETKDKNLICDMMMLLSKKGQKVLEQSQPNISTTNTQKQQTSSNSKKKDKRKKHYSICRRRTLSPTNPTVFMSLNQLETYPEEIVPTQLFKYCYSANAVCFIILGKTDLTFIHQNSYPSMNSFTAEKCQRITSIPCLLCDHISNKLHGHLVHNLQEHFLCKTCQKAHTDVKSLIAHWKSHEEGRVYVWYCKPCNMCFTDPNLLDRHTSLNPTFHGSHKNPCGVKQISARVGSLECPYCSLNFVKELRLIEHILELHNYQDFDFQLKTTDVVSERMEKFKQKSLPVLDKPIIRSTESDDEHQMPEEVQQKLKKCREAIRAFNILIGERVIPNQKGLNCKLIDDVQPSLELVISLDELEFALSEEDGPVERKILQYCYNMNARQFYLRKENPVFVYVMSSLPVMGIKVEASRRICAVPCLYCPEVSASLYTHREHVIAKHFLCMTCQIEHKDAQALVQHFGDHLADKINHFYCGKCVESFFTQLQVKEHSNNETHIVYAEPSRSREYRYMAPKCGALQCPYCMHNFVKELTLIEHVLEHHKVVKFDFNLDGVEEIKIPQEIRHFLQGENTKQLLEIKGPNVSIPGTPSFAPAVVPSSTSNLVTVTSIEDPLLLDQTIEEKVMRYCQQTSGTMSYIRLKNPIFVYVHKISPESTIEVEFSKRITGVPCLFCQEIFPTLKEHFAHLVKQHFACKTCHITHHDAESLLEHLKLHEMGNILLLYCSQCWLSFKTYSALQYHLSRHATYHSNGRLYRLKRLVLSARVGNLQCPYCSFNFVIELNLINHVHTYHKVANFTFEPLDTDVIDWEVPKVSEENPKKANHDSDDNNEEIVSDSDEDLLTRRNRRLLGGGLRQIERYFKLGYNVDELLMQYCYDAYSHAYIFRQWHYIFINLHSDNYRPIFRIEASERITCIPCQFCQSSFESLRDHLFHVIHAHYACKTCQIQHHDMQGLIEHMKLHELGVVCVYACKICKNIFYTWEEFSKHLSKYHANDSKSRKSKFAGPQSTSSRVGDLECPYCLINYAHEIDLIRHVIQRHHVEKFDYQLLDGEELGDIVVDDLPPQRENSSFNLMVRDTTTLPEDVQRGDEEQEAASSNMQADNEADTTPDTSQIQDEPADNTPVFVPQQVEEIAEPQEEIESFIEQSSMVLTESQLLLLLDKLPENEEEVLDKIIEHCYNIISSKHHFLDEDKHTYLYLNSITDTDTTLQVDRCVRITSIKCLHCSQTFTDLRSHFEHQIKIHFSCKICQENFKDTTSLIIHLHLHEDNEIAIHICNECSEAYVVADNWSNHVEEVHDSKLENYVKFNDISIKVNSIQCPYCCLNFAQEHNLIYHIVKSHEVNGFTYNPLTSYIRMLNDDCYIYQIGDPTILFSEKPKILKNIPCMYCDQKSLSLELHNKHLEEVHYFCKPCKKSHSDINKLKLHQLEHELKTVVLYLCKECNILLTNAVDCKPHFVQHKTSLEKITNMSCHVGSLECPYCSLNYFSEINLVKHMVQFHKNQTK